MSDTSGPPDDGGGFIIAPIRGGGADVGPSWLNRLGKGMAKSSAQLSERVVETLTKKRLDASDLEALEELLIEADLGPAAAARVADAFGKARFGKESSEAEVKESLAEAITQELIHRQGRFDPLTPTLGRAVAKPQVVLFVGVNGSGKTTTLGKLAFDMKRRGHKVLVAAGDTFRAAAVEQLAVWADRAGVPIVTKPPGSDAAALAFEAVERARREGFDIVLDRHGRAPAEQIRPDGRIGQGGARAEEARPRLPAPDAPGAGRHGGPQRALSQVEVFGKTAGVTGVVMTKLDGTARGGVLVPIAAASLRSHRA